jgi:hypothetical protein
MKRIELMDTDYRLKIEKSAAILTICAIYLLWHEGAYGNLLDAADTYAKIFKIGICGVSVFIGVRIFHKGMVWPGVAFAIVAILFNPFLPLRLDGDNWLVIYAASGLALIWATYQLFRLSSVMVRRLEMAKARAEAIDEALADGRIDAKQYEDFVRKLMPQNFDRD